MKLKEKLGICKIESSGKLGLGEVKSILEICVVEPLAKVIRERLE